MSPEILNRGPDVADEHGVAPAVFERYARDLVERARPIGPSDRILDLGCGTGIVARVLRERLGGAASIVGLDARAPMLAEARAMAPEIEWHEGNAAALPFQDESFDVVLSQEMLQRAQERAAVLREVARVLTPGGRVLAATIDGGALRDALVAAGFVDVHLEAFGGRTIVMAKKGRGE